MFSSAVSSSSRLWSWKTIPIALRTPSWSLVTSIPMTVAVPEVGSSMVESIESVVVLPAPFGPRRPKISPCSISKLIRSTATRSPKRRVRSAAWIAVVMSDHIFFSLSRQCSRIAPTLRSFPRGHVIDEHLYLEEEALDRAGPGPEDREDKVPEVGHLLV